MSWLSGNLEYFKNTTRDYFNQYYEKVEVSSKTVTAEEKKKLLQSYGCSDEVSNNDIQVDVACSGGTFTYFGEDVENKSPKDFANELFGDLLLSKANQVFENNISKFGGLNLYIEGSSILNSLNITVNNITEKKKFNDYYSDETEILDIDKIVHTADSINKTYQSRSVSRGLSRGIDEKESSLENKSFKELNLKIPRPLFLNTNEKV